MNYAQARRSYQKIAVETVGPGQRILMLFDGCLGSLEKALVGFQCTDRLEFSLTINNNIQHAQEIIRELNASLDLKKGGEFALTMRRLYVYFDERLRESNVKKKKDGLQEVRKHMTTLRDAWAQMLNQQILTDEPVEAVATGVAQE